MKKTRVGCKAKRFFFQLVKGRIQTVPPGPGRQCEKLDKPIQLKDEQVSYHSANCIRTTHDCSKSRVMSEITHASKFDDVAKAKSSVKCDGKTFHKPVLFRVHLSLQLDAAKPRGGDLRGRLYAADLFGRPRGASRFARCLVTLPVVPLRQARLLNLINKGAVTNV